MTGGKPEFIRGAVMHGQLALARRGAARPGSEAPGNMSAMYAARVIDEAQEQERARAEGISAGYEEGFAQGQEDARRAAEPLLETARQELASHARRQVEEFERTLREQYEGRMQAVQHLLEAVPAQIDARLQAVSEDALALCFEVVCKILGERAMRPEVIRAQVEAALRSVHRDCAVTVHLHPDDLQALRTDSGDAREDSRLRWVADASLTLGGCVLRTPAGDLDARLDTQIAALRELFLESRAAGRAAHG